jgi:hypothetical protein
MSHRSFGQMATDSKYFMYDPYGASLPIANNTAGDEGYYTDKPISYIEPYFSLPTGEEDHVVPSFFERASHSGTVFIYAKNGGYDPNETITL